MIGAALVATAAFADKVYLKSGSFLSGTVGGATSDEVVFNSDDLGEVKIKIANIVKLENAGSHVVKYVDNSTETRKLSVEKGLYVADAKPLDMTKVKEIDPVEEKWHGSVNVAFNATRGNTYENSAAVVANVNRRWEKDRLNVDFGYYYGEDGKAGTERTKNEDRWDVEAKHDHFWWEKVYHYENLKWERDEIQDLNARYRVGLGGGYQWLDNSVFESTGKWNFNQEVGINWVKEEYAHGGDADKNGFAALRYGHHLGYIPKWAESIEIFHNLEVLPDVGDWEKFLANADLGFSTKLIYDFDLLAKIEWDYNSQPANDRKKSDYRYIIGLGYKW